MDWLLFTILFILAVFLDAWYDWTEETGKDQDFLTDRFRKIAKAGNLIILLAGGWFMQWRGLLLYTGLRFLLFDFIYYSFRFGKIFLDLNYYWKHSEIYYWYLLLAGRRAFTS